jgi:putative PIN family toxin of toxin-antitoxin system
MKAVIDTNVFVSGIFWKGPPFKILKAWQQGEFKLVISPEIFEEYRRVLRDLSVKRPGVNVDHFLDLVSVQAEVVNAPRFAKPVCTDPDDDKFLAAALAGRTEYIVTGDRALLKTNGFQDIKVMEPSGFIRQLKALER